MNNVVFIGLGHIGLPTASLIALSGHTVAGVDITVDAVERSNACRTSFKEPGRDALVHEAVQSGTAAWGSGFFQHHKPCDHPYGDGMAARAVCHQVCP